MSIVLVKICVCMTASRYFNWPRSSISKFTKYKPWDEWITISVPGGISKCFIEGILPGCGSAAVIILHKSSSWKLIRHHFSYPICHLLWMCEFIQASRLWPNSSHVQSLSASAAPFARSSAFKLPKLIIFSAPARWPIKVMKASCDSWQRTHDHHAPSSPWKACRWRTAANVLDLPQRVLLEMFVDCGIR